MNSSEDNTADLLRQSLIGERDRLQPEIEQLRQELASKGQRLQHVLALLSNEPIAGEGPPRRARPRSGATPTAQLLDMAEAILRERESEPMHYRDLTDEIRRRGRVIGGKDPAASLVSRMTQDKAQRFIRPTSKGFYALREDYPNARNVGARQRRNASD
ncbi:MAG: HTH domain-containing protein [Chloroflexi bacterium]|nr:HTH domain-containing protein [Chloroflexota bacterium]MCY4247223.1 HTH domain-containing protein [Chloroflexota bacterium]